MTRRPALGAGVHAAGLTPRTVDRLLVAVVLAFALAELALADLRGPVAAEVAVGAAMAAVLLLRRRPAAAAAALVGIAAVQAAELTSIDRSNLPFVVLLCVAWAAGRYGQGREVAATYLLLVAAVCVVNLLVPADPVVGDYVFPALIAGGTLLAGRTVAARDRLVAELHEATARAREAHEREAQDAIAAERRRIARELHDVVAHSVSVMVVQAGGARRILGHDPGRAAEAAAAIEQAGRTALGEMRRLLGVLQPDAGPGPLEPAPTLAALPALVRRAGLPATLAVAGTPRPAPAGFELSAYRIVQEALTNALKHGGGAATEVAVTWDDDGLRLDVVSAAPGGASGGGDRPPGAPSGAGPSGGAATPPLPSGGHGLVGMAERARLYGGTLDARPTTDGGFAVHAVLPYATRPAVAA